MHKHFHTKKIGRVKGSIGKFKQPCKRLSNHVKDWFFIMLVESFDDVND